MGVSLSDLSSRPSHICFNRPETFLSVPNRLCFTGHTKTNNYNELKFARVNTEALCAAEARTSSDKNSFIVITSAQFNDEAKVTVPVV